MSNWLLLALMCLSATGLACAAAWSRQTPRHPQRWDAALALVLALAAIELILLGSPLGLMFPVLALVGLPLPLAVGPLWWRSRSHRAYWSWRRWVLRSLPGALALVVLVALYGMGADMMAESGLLPMQVMLVAALVNVGICTLRAIPVRLVVPRAHQALAH
jgi:hypothetical protein